jgi:hypothetical protein
MQRRLTDDEQKKLRDAWETLSQIQHLWQEIDSVRLAIRLMFEQDTTDGLPYVEPPLTDEDARQRPWVMVRDHETASWHGPVVFVDKLPNGRYVCRTRCQKGVNVWFECRRATASEIAAAGLDTPDA